MQVEETAKSVLGMYQKAIASADLLPSDKEDLSARACTFADMCGSAAMQEAAERLHAARWASLHHHLDKCWSPFLMPFIRWAALVWILTADWPAVSPKYDCVVSLFMLWEPYTPAFGS